MSARHSLAELVHNATQDILRDTLAEVSELGVLQNQSVVIVFKTGWPGVGLSDELRSQFPDEMAIIIQRRFKNLVAYQKYFAVTLYYKHKAERLIVPYDAVTTFSEKGSNSHLVRSAKHQERLYEILRSDQSQPSVQENTPRVSATGRTIPDIFAERLHALAADFVGLVHSSEHPAAPGFALRFSGYPEAGGHLNIDFSNPTNEILRATETKVSLLIHGELTLLPFEAVTLLDAADASVWIESPHEADEQQSAHHITSRESVQSPHVEIARDPATAVIGRVTDSSTAPSTARARLIVGAVFLALFCSLYLRFYGIHPEFILCGALMKIDRVCAGHGSDAEILDGLRHQFSIQALPLILTFSLVLLATGFAGLSQIRGLDIRKASDAYISIRGFFGGFTLAKVVLSIISGRSQFANGILFNWTSFIAIYCYYIFCYHVRFFIPNYKSREVEYNFIFDSLFTLGAVGLFSLGLDKSVDTVTSGAVFIMCSFLMMLYTRRIPLFLRKRLEARKIVFFHNLADVGAPSTRALFRSYLLAKQDVKRMNEGNLNTLLQTKVDQSTQFRRRTTVSRSLNRMQEIYAVVMYTITSVLVYWVWWYGLKFLLILFGWITKLVTWQFLSIAWRSWTS